MRILIIDDHVVVREGVRRLLAALPDTEVFEASSAREALSLYRSKAPDILLLDLNLPNSSGFELLRRLLLENRQVKVVVLSMHAEPIYVSRTLNAGARGYVSKMASADELIAAVREVAAGGRYVEREIAAQLVVSQYGGANPLEKLTPARIVSCACWERERLRRHRRGAGHHLQNRRQCLQHHKGQARRRAHVGSHSADLPDAGAIGRRLTALRRRPTADGRH